MHFSAERGLFFCPLKYRASLTTGLPQLSGLRSGAVRSVLQQLTVPVTLHDQQQHQPQHTLHHHHHHVHPAGAASCHHQPGPDGKPRRYKSDPSALRNWNDGSLVLVLIKLGDEMVTSKERFYQDALFDIQAETVKQVDIL